MSRITSSRLARPVTALLAAGCAAALVAGCGALPAGSDVGRAPVTRVEVVPVVQTTALHAARADVATASARGAGKVRAYGDSVMLGAAWALRKRLHAHVDAAVSRQSYELLSIVRRDWAAGRINGPVVIHTGTNGTVTRKDLVRTVRPIQKRFTVLLVNVKLPSRYTWTGSNNSVIASVDRRWAHVLAFDWHTAGGKHPSWFAKDGTHLTSAGGKAYAREIAKRLGR